MPYRHIARHRPAAVGLVPLVAWAKVYDQLALGIPSVLVVTLLLGGIQLMCLGIAGEFVVRGGRNPGAVERHDRRERHPERIVAGR